ncbi:uncharacterized protein BDCG_17835 [Blastomyces dermatitidis ER-3]|uniref:Uncharacterized protein n=1 Tax=Ajellomyces dermatitidis (strain ER-3 / ATCC MYA-2586) TaxID=559297 RepID=A0ABX2W0K9_AJEDR|nr:uncharacterized protein BDCG_17835 [Blastomyces dermatitidis ER-3]OAT02921.1 hypothetical protein BDCG_17835 [Blastomyces dermatitidis ER-3]
MWWRTRWSFGAEEYTHVRSGRGSAIENGRGSERTCNLWSVMIGVAAEDLQSRMAEDRQSRMAEDLQSRMAEDLSVRGICGV